MREENFVLKLKSFVDLGLKVHLPHNLSLEVSSANRTAITILNCTISSKIDKRELKSDFSPR